MAVNESGAVKSDTPTVIAPIADQDAPKAPSFRNDGYPTKGIVTRWFRDMRVGLRIVLVLLLPIAVSLGLAGVIVMDKRDLMNQSQHRLELSKLVTLISDTVRALQKERDASHYFLASRDKSKRDPQSLTKAYEDADEVIYDLKEFLEEFAASGADAEQMMYVTSSIELLKLLDDKRSIVRDRKAKGDALA